MRLLKNTLMKSFFNAKFNYILNPLKLMKIASLLIFTLFATSSMQAQDDEPFVRDGRWLVETGFNIFTGITGGGTGANIISVDGNSFTTVGAELGKFLSNNFALKAKFGLVSSDGSSITSFGLGGKYYSDGNFIIDFGGILVDAFGTEFQGNLGIGYAISLAPNVMLEPTIGGLYADEDLVFNLRVGFAMFL
ncbi:MAG: hypothetical protein AAGA77_01795 [Bacteroidota bacterium]